MNPTFPQEDSSEEIDRMHCFLVRVLETAPADIKITGNPETDENTEVLGKYEVEDFEGGKRTTIGTLCKSAAARILTFLFEIEEGGPDAGEKLVLARQMFTDYIGKRHVLYK